MEEDYLAIECDSYDWADSLDEDFGDWEYDIVFIEF